MDGKQIVAAGPWYKGRGTLPHRLVLLHWPDGIAPGVDKWSVHYQNEYEPGKYSFFEGEYFHDSENPLDAYRSAVERFGGKVAHQAKVYGPTLITTPAVSGINE